MRIEFVSSVGVVAADPERTRRLYVEALGLPLTPHEGTDYWFSDQVGGSKHFSVWPLREAAEACFGTSDWPADLVVPQVSLEFELADEAAVAEAVEELADRGFTMLHGARTEPWGQTVARLLSEEGSIVGLSYAPWMHD